ncbi:hypothetical protein [Catenovulum agarivorans]|uniref:hypothetical protein n=1 Tax=Catenovulum agarivorans TaxID=1172192 RepID=UPI000310A478|nr:hypothetical protein [Catenovulum agarivorans]
MGNHVGDAICTCGRVAKIKRQSNGQKVPYRHCKNCGVFRPKTDDDRETMLADMSEIGTLGEFGKIVTSTSNEPNNGGDVQHQTHVTSTSSEWTPPDDLKPEVLEPTSNNEQAVKPDAPKKKPTNWGWVLKAGLGVVGLIAAGYGAGKLSNISSIHGK